MAALDSNSDFGITVGSQVFCVFVTCISQSYGSTSDTISSIILHVFQLSYNLGDANRKVRSLSVLGFCNVWLSSE